MPKRYSTLYKLRFARHIARHILSRNCDRCHCAIDTGQEYTKYVAVVYGEFYWTCTHERCYGYDRT